MLRFLTTFSVLMLGFLTSLSSYIVVQPALYIEHDDGTCQISVFGGEDCDTHLYDVIEMRHAPECSCIMSEVYR